MKTLALTICLSLTTLLLSGCHTARWAAHGAADESEHAVEKTAHAVHHGVRKAERHL